MTAPWEPERVAHLSLLVQTGDLTFGQIGIAMHMTKNAAIGKARRMGITGPRSKGPNTPEPTTLDQRLDAIAAFPPAGHCVYPFGDVGREGFRFCGVEAEDGSAYCAAHRKVIYRPEPARER